MKFLKSLAGFIPVIVFEMIQIGMAMVVMMGVSFMTAFSNPSLASDPTALSNAMLEKIGELTMPITFASEIVTILAFGIWYWFAYVRKHSYAYNPVRVLTKNSIPALPMAFLGMYFFVSLYMVIISVLFPHAMDVYNDMMSTNFGDFNDILTIITAIILAPIAEELCFRGLTVKLFRWAGLGMWLTIFISAFIFGLVHIDPTHFTLIQFGYTFILGALLAYLAISYDSIYVSILGHIVFNFCGTIVSSLEAKLPESVQGPYIIIAGIIGIGLIAGAVLLVWKDPRAQENRNGFGIKRIAKE